MWSACRLKNELVECPAQLHICSRVMLETYYDMENLNAVTFLFLKIKGVLILPISSPSIKYLLLMLMLNEHGGEEQLFDRDFDYLFEASFLEKNIQVQSS